MIDDLFEVRTPPTKVIVDEDDWHVGPAGTFTQASYVPGGGKRRPQEFFTSIEVEIVDYINEKYGYLRLVRRVTMQIILNFGRPLVQLQLRPP